MPEVIPVPEGGVIARGVQVVKTATVRVWVVRKRKETTSRARQMPR